MSEPEHERVFSLLTEHASITREVREIPGGVETKTTTTDADLVPVLRKHAREMLLRVERQEPVRMWDPVFRSVFEHGDKVKSVATDIDGGILVRETSDDPEVAPMIRAHAAKVSTFVDKGHAAARPPWAGGRRF